MATKKELITEKTIELLEATPLGIQFSELVAQLHVAFPEDPHGTITGTIWNLDVRQPDLIYKPLRGLFRLTRYRETAAPIQASVTPTTAQTSQGSLREIAFYEPFADFLVNDLEECTKAIALGGNRFGGKWGTQDVFGIGLILFDATQPENPAFQIRVRAARHEPDAFYVNQNVKLIADQLGL